MARTKLGIALSLSLWMAPVWMAQVTGCGGAAASREDGPVVVADAGPDAHVDPADTTCCRLDNEAGERLGYMCSATATLNIEWAVERGYRCWKVD